MSLITGKKQTFTHREPNVALKYEGLLKRFLKSDGMEERFSEQDQDKELTERLKSLGYL